MASMELDAVLLDLDDTLFDRNAAQPLGLEALIDSFPEILGGVEWEHALGAFVESNRLSTIEYDRGLAVFLADALQGPHCGARMQGVAALTDPDSIRTYLTGLGLPAEAPTLTPPRSPPQQELDFGY